MLGNLSSAICCGTASNSALLFTPQRLPQPFMLKFSSAARASAILCCAICLFQLTFFTIELGKGAIFFEKTLV